MTPRDLLAAFDVLAEAPDGVARLRELVLQLAVRGKLVPQDPEDEPATVFVSSLADRRAAMVESGVIQAPRHPLGMDVERPPHEIPENWCWVRLGDVGAIVGGGTPKSSEPSYWSDGEGVPWLTPADMAGQPSRYIVRGRRDISDEGLARSAARLLPTGTVLFSSRAPIGHVGIAASPIATNQGFKSCVPYHPDLSEYLFVYLKKAAREIDEAATGTTFKEVSGKEVSLVPVPVPPLAEQRRIVTRVDELMSLLDRLEAARTQRDGTRAALRDAALAALRDAEDADAVEVAWARVSEHMADLFVEPGDVEPLRQTILHLAVRGRLVHQDPKDEPASALLARIKVEKTSAETEKRVRTRKRPLRIGAEDCPYAIPSGWLWCRIGDLLLDIEAGKSPLALKRPKEGDEWGVLKVSACSWGRFKAEENKALPPDIEPHVDFEVRDGDLLISRANTLELVARSVVVEAPPPRLMLSDKTLRLVCAPSTNTHFVNLANLSAAARAHYEQHATGTSASMRNVGQDVIWNAPIPLPPAAEQPRIVARVHDLMALCDDLERKLRSARDDEEAFAAAAVYHLET